jgi:small-conductance mechanosensitive channel
MNTAGLTLLLLIFGMVVYCLVKWLWPIIEQRKHLTLEQMIERALQAPAEAAYRQATKFGSRTGTAVVILLNALLLSAWSWVSPFSSFVFWLVLGYLTVGFVVQRIVRVPAASELVGLNVIDRIWIKTFYAWFWPAYIPCIKR